jgi:hypothetical protein
MHKPVTKLLRANKVISRRKSLRLEKIGESYRVKSVTNATHPNPNDYFLKQEVENLMGEFNVSIS